MNDDEGPPPIPPYRPEQSAQGPQDGPDPQHEVATHDERERALESLEAKADFRGHLTMYLLVMLLLVGIWGFSTGFSGFFWPVFPMMGWGLGVAIHGFSLGWDRAPSEAEIAAEMAKLRRRPGQQQGRLEE